MRLLAILLATQALQPVLSQPACHDSNITVHVSKTTNISFVNQVYDLDILYALAGKQILVSNSYSISSRLCEPSQTNTHSDTLQVMIHGASFNKNMWDSQYQPETYSWVQRMNKGGYYTLAVDLIGNPLLWITRLTERCINLKDRKRKQYIPRWPPGGPDSNLC